ncbi:arginine N-succinyltransferase [Phycisphaerales bacterium]|nr:arginine N-succinyltransferase [Phycisphaerales bacterium]
MFLVRQSKAADVSTLLKLARMVYFINLPPNETIMQGKIDHSARCFKRISGAKVEQREKPRKRKPSKISGWAEVEEESDAFMFTIEDTETRGVIGTSQIRAHQGGPGNPNWTFRITEKTFRSQRLGWGSTHKVGQLFGDETGPSEIGGLIIQPSYRGHKLRPGRLLSFVRFHWLALHRELFADRILAEMMGPVTEEGDNIFWDNFGRKFIPVRFGEADRFCQHNRNFISELLPKEEIYLSLFPLEVQNQIGVVGRETIPAVRLLEDLGFKNHGFVDPFDGGPHLDAVTAEVPLIRDTRRVEAARATNSDRCTTPAIISTLDKDGELRATETRVELLEDAARVPANALTLIQAKAGTEIGLTSLASIVPPDTGTADAAGATPDGAAKRRAPRKKVRS